MNNYHRLTIFATISLLLVILVLPVLACTKATPTTKPPSPTPAAPSRPTTATASPTASPLLTSTPAVKAVVLKAVTTAPINSYSNVGLWMLRDKVKELSKGDLTIEITGGPEVIPSIDQGSAVKRGVVDISHAFASGYAGIVGIGQTTMFSKLSWQDEKRVGYEDLLRSEYLKAGLYYLGRGSDSTEPLFNVLVKKKIDKPQDLANMKIGGVVSSTFKPLLDSLGSVFVLVPSTDAYVGLQTGLVEGFADTANTFVAVKLQEVKGLYLIDHLFYRSNWTFIMNPDSYNKLPQNMKDILAQAHKEVMTEEPALFAQKIRENQKIMTDAGVQRIKFTAADEKFYLDTAYDAGWQDLFKRNPEDVVRKAREFLEGKK